MCASRCVKIQKEMGNFWSNQGTQRNEFERTHPQKELGLNVTLEQDSKRSSVGLDSNATAEEERHEELKKQLLEKDKLKDKLENRVRQLETEAEQRLEEHVQDLESQDRFIKERLLGETSASNKELIQSQQLPKEHSEIEMKSQQALLNDIAVRVTQIQQSLAEGFQRLMPSHQETIDQMTLKMKELVNDVERLKMKNADLRTSLKKQRDIVTQLSQENEIFNGPQCPRVDCQEIQKKAAKMQNDLPKTAERRNRLKAQNSKLAAGINELQKANADIKAEQCKLQKLCEKLEENYHKESQKAKYLQEELHKMWKENQNLKSSPECPKEGCMHLKHTVTHLQNELHKIQQENHNFKSSPVCPRKSCKQIKQTATYLQEELNKKTSQLEKLSLMKQLETQQSTAHDQLKAEYEELWVPELILEKVEEHIEDPFDAKRLVTEIFMIAYEGGKMYLMEHLKHNLLHDLYSLDLEMDENKKAHLEKMSRTFGSLLHYSGAKTEQTQEKAVEAICKMVKNTIQKRSKVLAESTVRLDFATLPLHRMVEVAWKFVTQPCPIIVTMPEKFDAEIHEESYSHWDESCGKSNILIYAKPVLFRSYHGVKLKSGLVGNTLEKQH